MCYYGLDLSYASLDECITQMSTQYKYVECYGLWGTFDDAQLWVASVASPKWLLSLGSILGNDFFEPAIAMLGRWTKLMSADDRMLLAMDGTTNHSKVWNSYNDSQGLFERFMRNGLTHSNRVLGHNWYRPEDWVVIPMMTVQPLMHRFVFQSLRIVSCPEIGISFPANYQIDCYEAFKYTPADMQVQFSSLGLHEEGRWNAAGSSICW